MASTKVTRPRLISFVIDGSAPPAGLKDGIPFGHILRQGDYVTGAAASQDTNDPLQTTGDASIDVKVWWNATNKTEDGPELYTATLNSDGDGDVLDDPGNKGPAATLDNTLAGGGSNVNRYATATGEPVIALYHTAVGTPHALVSGKVKISIYIIPGVGLVSED